MATTFSAMFGAPRPGPVSIAGRRDVVGAGNATAGGTAPHPHARAAGLSPPGAERHNTPTLRRLKSMRLERAVRGDDEQARPSSMPLMAGARVAPDGREAHRKRVVISPSQWFNKVVNTPKATRCTIRDSPSHAMAIAALRDNNRVRELREMHRKIIQSSAQPAHDMHHHHDGAGAALPPAAADQASPPPARDALHVEGDGGRGRRMSLSPRRSAAKTPGTAVRSPSPPTPTPFHLRVEEMEHMTGEHLALAAR